MGGLGQSGNLVRPIHRDVATQIAVGNVVDLVRHSMQTGHDVTCQPLREQQAQHNRGHAHHQRGDASAVQRCLELAGIHGDFHHANGLVGKVVQGRRIQGNGPALHRAVLQMGLAREYALQRSRIKQWLFAQRGGQGFEVVRRSIGHIHAHIDTIVFFELLKKRLAQAHTKLHRAHMAPVVLYRHHATHTQPCHAPFQATHGFLRLVGLHHGMAEGGKIVAKLGGQMHAQPRGGWGRVELELLNAHILHQALEAWHEHIAQGLAIASVEFFLHQRHAGHQRSQRLGGAALSSHGIGDGLVVRAQGAAFGVLHHAREIGQVGEREHGADATNCQAHHQHDLGPQAQSVEHGNPSVSSSQAGKGQALGARTLKQRTKAVQSNVPRSACGLGAVLVLRACSRSRAKGCRMRIGMGC